MSTRPHKTRQQLADEHDEAMWREANKERAEKGLQAARDKLNPTIARLEAEKAELVEALALLTKDAEQSINDCGGCDHSVGICMCPEIGHLETAHALLKKHGKG